MRRNVLNFVIDAATLLVMLALAATGLLVHFVLPPGSGGRGGGVHSTVWGWGRHDWGDLHLWLSAALGVLLVVHVALHWKWVCGTIARMCGRSNTQGRGAWARSLYGALGLGATAALLVGFVWLAAGQVVNAPQPSRAAVREGTSIQPALHLTAAQPGHDGEIRGSMTLAEVAEVTGVSAEILRADLKLPESVSLGERLGRLGREYGFAMSQVREAVRLRQSDAAAR